MDKNNPIENDQFNQLATNPIPAENIYIQSNGQNKYPKFDMEGDNYSKKPSDLNNNSLQENINLPTPPSTEIPSQVSSPEVIGSVHDSKSTDSQSATDQKYASVRMRFSAYFLDGLIIGLFAFAFDLSIFITLVNTKIIPEPIYTVLTFIPILLGFTYYIYFIGKDGATPGKKHYGVKVVDRTTLETPGYMKAFLREVIGKFASQLFFSIGYFWAIWDKDKQAWHDKIAGTIVINTK